MLMSKLRIATSVLLVVVLLGVLTLSLLAQNQKEKEAVPQPATATKMQMSHDALVRCVAFSPDGKTLASAADNKTIKLWDVVTGKEQATLKGHIDWVWSLAYSPDGKTLASGSKDTTIKLWDMGTSQEQATLPGHTDWRCPVAFSPDGTTLAGGSENRTIKLWDVRTAKVRAILKWRHDWLAEQVAPIPKQEVALAYSPDGKTLASGNVDKTIKLWDMATFKERATLKGHVGDLTCLVYSPDGQTLASAGGPINLWDVKTGKLQTVLMAQTHFPLTSLTFSPDGKTLASSGQGKAITLWDVQTGKERATLTEQTDHVFSVAFSPDGKLLASARSRYTAADGWLGTIKLWDVATKDSIEQDIRKMQGFGAIITVVGSAVGQEERSPDKKTLQGTWQVIFNEEKGVKSSADGIHKITFTGNKIHQLHKVPNGADFQYSFKLDSTKNPAEIEMTITKAGNVKDKEEVGKTVLGIFSLDGDNLKLCTDPTVRPTTFQTKGKSRDTILMVLKRPKN